MFGLGAVQATFTIQSGKLRVADPVTDSTVTLIISAGSFRSGNHRRDKEVRSPRFLNAVAFPVITFASRGLRKGGEGWLLEGDVTAHGTTAPVEVVIERVYPESGSLRVHARADHVDRYAFGVVAGKGMASRYCDLLFDLVAIRA